MKKIIILSAFTLFIGTNAFAQSGIQFNHAPWEEVLAQAQKENKLIFVDAYTTWCAPCKKMSKVVFTHEKVGEFYNTRFINVKMDMEEGEGIALSKKYHVMAFPTLLFIDDKGDIIHRKVGYHNPEEMLALGDAALDPNKQLASLDSRYSEGNRDPEFLYNYTLARFDAMDGSHVAIAEAYLDTQKDWGTEKNLGFIYRFVEDPDSKMFDYMVENQPAFEEKFGERAVVGKIQNLVQARIYETEEHGGDVVEVAARLFGKVYPEEAELMVSHFRMMYYRQAGETDKYAKAAIAHFDKYPARNWDELNEVAWSFYEKIDNKKYLKQALKWSKTSVEMESNYYNNDTLASLYFKLGKKRKALKTVEKAIAFAKESGEDYSLTEELLEKIKEM